MEKKLTLAELMVTLGEQKGTVRMLDSLGRVVIPQEYRAVLDWDTDDMLDGQLYENAVLLVKSNKKEKGRTDRIIDNLGRIVVPKEFRVALNVKAGEAVELQLYANAVLLLKSGHGN